MTTIRRNKRSRKSLPKDKVLNFTFKDAIFRKEFDIIVGAREPAMKLFEKKYPPTKGEGIFTPEHAGLYIVMQDTESFDKCGVLWISSIDYDTIVHECFHATFDSLKEDGIELTEDTNEVFAYHVAWMFSQIRNNLSKLGY